MKATLPEPEIVTRKGKPVSVIISIKDCEELLERVEESSVKRLAGASGSLRMYGRTEKMKRQETNGCSKSESSTKAGDKGTDDG
jgi:hypothetical protein